MKKVKLNIPLLDAIKQIPKYAKFLKELCTTKRAFKLKGHEMVSVAMSRSHKLITLASNTTHKIV